MVDGTGSTAEELANEKHHRLLSLFLRSELDKRRAKARHRHWLIKAAISAQFAPVVWVVGLASVYTHARYVVYASALPPPLPWMRGWSIAAILFCTAAFVVLAMVNVSDPGFLAQTSVADAHALARAKDKKCDFKKSDVDGGAGAGDNEFRVLLVPNPREQLQSLDCPALWAGSWGQLCVTCKIVRPLRAKHDAYTNRCIEVRLPSPSAAFVSLCDGLLSLAACWQHCCSARADAAMPLYRVPHRHCDGAVSGLHSTAFFKGREFEFSGGECSALVVRPA